MGSGRKNAPGAEEKASTGFKEVSTRSPGNSGSTGSTAEVSQDPSTSKLNEVKNTQQRMEDMLRSRDRKARHGYPKHKHNAGEENASG